MGICVVSNSFLYCIDMFPDSIDLKKRSTGKILNFQSVGWGKAKVRTQSLRDHKSGCDNNIQKDCY